MQDTLSDNSIATDSISIIEATPNGYLEWGVACVFAFLGGWFAKQVEYKSLFGDQYYFLRNHKNFKIYSIIYGLLAILNLLIMGLGVYKAEIVPNLEAMNTKWESLLLVAFVGFITGFGSKAILDVPITPKKESNNSEPFTLSTIIKFFYPNPVKDADIDITEHKTNYFENATYLLQKKGITLDNFYEQLDRYLKNIKEFTGDAGEPKYRVFFEKLNEKKRTYDKFLFIYDNLGRKHFENIMRRFDIGKIPRHKSIRPGK